MVTLPTLGIPSEITREYLLSRYVGRENLIRFQEWYRDAGSWVEAWEKSGMEHAEATGEHEDEVESASVQK